MPSYYINQDDSFALAGTNYHGPLGSDILKKKTIGPSKIEICLKKCAHYCESCEGTYDNCTTCKEEKTRDMIAPNCNCKHGYVDFK